jgi:hypothetical protein
MNATVFFAQWEEFHTGLFPTNNGIFGVTEALLLDALVHFLTAAYGPQVCIHKGSYSGSCFSLSFSL